MSQVVRIKRISFRGTPAYLGEHDGNAIYSGNPDRVSRWLADAYRTRFNQLRSNRSKYVYNDGEQLFDGSGNPLLEPIGTDVVTVTDKQAREQFTFLAGVPSMILQHPTKVENAEWFASVARRKKVGGSLPGFRSRKRGDNRFACWFNDGTNAVFHRTGKKSGMVVFRGQNPKIAKRKGRWELRVHVRISQPIREYTSVQVDLSSKKVTFVSPAPVVDRSAASGIVGVDRGVTRTLAFDDGTFFNTPNTTLLDAEIKASQRRLAKKRVVAEKQGNDFRTSNRYRRELAENSKRFAKRTSIITDAIHKMTTDIARRYETVVLEALPASALSRKAKGKGSSAKRDLNRGIREARWATIASQLDYKTGGNTVYVNPAYTSQRCSRCGCIDKRNRKSQAEFVCVECGYEINADTNASVNIKLLYQKAWATPQRGGKIRRAETPVSERTPVEA